ncbi:hypothetical protein AB2M62_03630 [Sphingomonas sp. MMS12-HWE2-04]|uniref:hypothetical protein n=1 Tax=Sphingomonas sp. MMS12-HWE2-04 TaxID=3234199 RepID=UPI00384F46F9
MLSALDLAQSNLDEARQLRAAGLAYRAIARRLALSPSQIAHIRRGLKRTRLRKADPDADDRALPVSQSVLPMDLRRRLLEAGFLSLGDLADRIAQPDLPGLEAIPGFGPHRAHRVKTLLDQFGMLPAGPNDLRAQIEQLFPELSEEHATDGVRLAPARSSRPHSR